MSKKKILILTIFLYNKSVILTQKIQNMKTRNIHGFTLVELIVVILILAVLSTVAFVSYSWYGSTSRDSVRLTDLANIEKWFELMKIKSIEFPYPENSIDISSNGTVFQYQWDLSKALLETHLWIHDWGLDPQTHKPYTYVVNNQRNKFQVLVFLENQDVFAKYSIEKSHADNNQKYPQTGWDILWVLLDESTLEPIQDVTSDSQIDVSTTTNNYGLIMNSQVEKGDSWVLAKTANLHNFWLKSSCWELLQDNPELQNQDGIYTLAYKKSEIYDVYCDMTTDGWGWTAVISIADKSHFTFKAIAPGNMFWSDASTDEQKAQYLAKVEELNNSIFNFKKLWSIQTLFTQDTILESYSYVWGNEIMFADENNQYLTYDFTSRSLADYYIWVKYNDDNQLLPVKKTNISADVNDRGDLSLQMIWEDWDSAMYKIYHWSWIGPFFNANNNGTVDFDDSGYSVFYKKLWGKLNPIISDYVIRYVR